VIKKNAEIPGKVLSKFKDGIGDITMYHFLSEQEARGAGRLFAKTVIAPGNSIGLHTHEGDMEAYYILKGKALVSDNGTDVVLEAGDCNVCPDGHSHSIKNVGTDVLEYIAVILYTKQKDNF
jgi:mannose-6-phosphate isomerase-like protein (cupin superfamily)